jgi:hypothetical protein
MLGVFSLEGNSLSFYEAICIATVYCIARILREDIVRERRGSYNGCVVDCIPSFCWIIKRKDLKISLVDVAHTR